MAFLIKTGASRQDAEDAVQSAFIELAKQWVVVEQPKPWLRTTAFRMWLKVVHRIQPSELTDQLPESQVGDHSDDVIEKIDLVRLLRRLPPLQRTMMAFEIDGSTPTETAHALGTRPENVRQNLLRARRKLEALLDDDEGGMR